MGPNLLGVTQRRKNDYELLANYTKIVNLSQLAVSRIAPSKIKDS